MSKMNIEHRKYVRNPDLEYTSIEIRLDAIPTQFIINANVTYSLSEIKEFCKLISDVVAMEVRRLSQQDEGNEPATVAAESESEVPV